MWPDGHLGVTEVTKRPLTAATLFKNSIVALVDKLACKVRKKEPFHDDVSKLNESRRVEHLLPPDSRTSRTWQGGGLLRSRNISCLELQTSRSRLSCTAHPGLRAAAWSSEATRVFLWGWLVSDAPEVPLGAQLGSSLSVP